MSHSKDCEVQSPICFGLSTQRQEVPEKLFYMVLCELRCKVKVTVYDTYEYLKFLMKMLIFVL